ncbi:beta strand repeat-containing protein [Luteolibacter luteus]|uniref:Uncharacterized protein n=1 Tax=Luteolibacter luteus TaxID=2728835 RepID=A0A858RMT7_9BACT|nr:autotransporter-associated beta strand repeat-containing protein [Luteolibacter luteus]QJE97804.1 hypothetical protein HHL09_19125 [Luteolibacter luteus]
MTSHRLHQQLLALSLPVGWFLTPMVANGQANCTWNGTTSVNWNATANWNPAALPAAGDNIIINDTTTNGLTLNDASHTVGSVTVGTTGTRTSGFTLQTNANTLTIGNGIVADGAFTGVGPTFRGNFSFSQPETIRVAGDLGDVMTDRGLFLRSTNDDASATPRGTLTMNGNITKMGSGQLVILGFNLTGSGDFIVEEGSLKFNAGGNQGFSVGGTGNITVNGSSTLMISRNSGSFRAFTRPVIMNGNSTLQLGGNVEDTTLENSWTFNTEAMAMPVGRNFTLTGPFSGESDITKGSFLNGATTYAGSLTLAGDTSGYVGKFTNNAGGIFLRSASFGGSLTSVAGTTVGGEADVAGEIDLQGVNLTVQADTPQSLNTSLDLSVSGTNTVTLMGALQANTPVKVISYDGFLLSGDETNFALAGGNTAYRGFAFTNNTAGKSIDVSVDAGDVTWTGATLLGNWDINTTANWTGTSDKFFQFDSVTFPNTASLKTVGIVTNVSPRSITFQNDLGSDYTINGPAFITGGASITKNGTGLTTLGGGNGQNYTGAIAVNSGVLRMGSRDAFGATSGITVASGAQVDISGQAPGTIASGAYTYTIAGTGVANAGALINSSTTSVDQGAGVKNLILSGDATLGGVGRFDIGRTTAAGSGVITGNGHTLTVKNTALIAFRGDASATPIHIIADAGRIYSEDTDNGFGGATGTVTVNSGARAGSYGVRTIPTPVTLNAGGILHNQGGGVGTWSGAITLAGAGATIEADGGQNIIISGSVTESGGAKDLIKAGNARLIFTGSALNTGNTVINNGFVQVGNGGTTGAINSNPINIGSATSGFIVNRSDDLTISNVISGTGPAANGADPGALTKAGTGTLTLTAANTYTGITRFGAGTIAIGSNETVFGEGGLLDFRGAGVRSSDATDRVVANPISYSFDTTFGSAGTGDLLFTGAVATGGGAKGFNVQNAITEFSGILSGSASTATLTKSGPGTLIFSNDNLYQQTTTISQGVLQMGNGGATGSLSSTNVINNASLVIDRTAPEGFDTFDFNNVVSGTGSLTYAGPDTINVNGNSTYTGDTILNGGIFSVQFPYLADTSSLRMTTDAKIDLFHQQTDTVNKFFINGTAQAVGTWGRIGSIAALGADFESALITGDGLLEVTSTGSATPYDDWATAAGLTGGDSASTANPDGDGFVNLAEFAFNGNPLSGATGGKIAVKIASVGGQQTLTLTLPVRTAASSFSGTTALTAVGDGITYTIEAGDNLGSWGLDVDQVTGADATAIQSELPALQTGWSYRTFRSPGTVTGDPIEFIRARVE